MGALGWSLTSPSATLALDATPTEDVVGPGGRRDLMLVFIGRCVVVACVKALLAMMGLALKG